VAVDPGLPDRLAGSVQGDGAFAHLEALQAIADREGGNRATGTRGYDASVDYVADTLRRAGFVVQTPTFTASAESDDESSAGGGTTRNVVAETASGRASEVVLAGAHLDSVPQGPGIDDDGSGVAALLETALRLGSNPPVTNKVRFVFFGAEEEGLLGSQNYVETLSSEQRRDIALMLNSDMIAGSNAGYFVYDGDNSDGRGEAAESGAATIETLLADRLGTLGAAPGRVPFNEDSDYDPFVKAGIPTGGLFSGDAGIKTPQEAAAWGGRAGVAYDPCYHQACDTLTNIDRVALDRMTTALAFGIGAFATDLRGLPPRDERESR
jgi:aminopeptidase S